MKKLLVIFCCAFTFSLHAAITDSLYFLSGTIGKDTVQLWISFDTTKACEGRIRPQNNWKENWFKGKLQGNLLSFTAKNMDGKTAGKFSGKFFRGDSIAGSWTDVAGKKSAAHFHQDLNGTGANLVFSFVNSVQKVPEKEGVFGGSATCSITAARIILKDTFVAAKINRVLFSDYTWFDSLKISVSNTYLKKVVDRYTKPYVAWMNASSKGVEFVQPVSIENITFVQPLYNGNGILSVVVQSYVSDFSRTSMDQTQVVNFFHTFDLRTGDTLNFKKIFLPGHEKDITALVQGKIMKENPGFIDSSQYNSNHPIPLSPVFEVNDSKIRVHYYSYALGSSFQPCDADLQWSEISAWIDPKGPMAWVKK